MFEGAGHFLMLQSCQYLSGHHDRWQCGFEKLTLEGFELQAVLLKLFEHILQLVNVFVERLTEDDNII